MQAQTLVVRGQHIIVGSSQQPASIHIRDGIIQAVKSYDDVSGATQVIDAAPGHLIMSGLVDSHVHINEPGRTEWEGFETATQAAAAGGITTVVDMPLNSSPVTTTTEALDIKIAAMAGQCNVDIALLGGVIPGNSSQLDPMVTEGGVVGFKCFMIHSGIDEFPAVDENQIREALATLHKIQERGFPVLLMFHAEVAGPIDEVAPSLSSEDPAAYNTFLKSRPKEAENQAIALVIKLAKETDVPVHIVHLSSADAIQIIADARASGVRITCETTFHYLHLQSENVPNGSTVYKCCPPIREKSNCDKLWDGLAKGHIQMVVSDHSPCTPDLKQLQTGDFLKAWGGIASLQLGLPIMWTNLKAKGLSPTMLSQWMSQNTARLVGLDDKKGSIKVGHDADLVIWDPNAEFVVDQTKLLIKNRMSPYHGHKLFGKVHKTILKGKVVYDETGIIAKNTGSHIVPTLVDISQRNPRPKLPPICRLNQFPEKKFQHVINLLFEAAPPLLAPLYAAIPFASYEYLIAKAQNIVNGLSLADKVVVINAHPRIGLAPSTLSAQSQKEQGHGTTLASELQQLKELIDQYEAKFGFGFVVFVNGRPKQELIPVIKERLQGEKQAELELGLSEMMKIAFSRLKNLQK